MIPSLEQLLADRASGLVLDAGPWRDREDELAGKERSLKPAYFLATAGHYQSQFVCIHQLFEHPEACEGVIERLAKAAREMKTKWGFNAIIACTVTARMLMDRLHSRLESTPDELKTLYLGNYPFLNPENQGLIALDGHKVLVLTDVIASTNTVQKICQLVRQRKGEPIGILAAVALDPAFGGQDQIDKVALRYLSRFPVERLQPEEVPKPFDEIQIDPLTVMPKSEPYYVNGYHACVPLGEALEHFRISRSLRAHFCQRDGRRFTSAIRFDRLLGYRNEQGRNPVFEASRDSLQAYLSEPDGPTSQWTLATTLNENDVSFASLFQLELPRDATRNRILYVPRTDTVQYRNRYFLPLEKVSQVQGEKVLLLLSSCNTGEKVTNLASLLASYRARRIHVLCLLNRLGPETADFVKRVSTLLNGTPSNPIRFSFQSIYDLPGFSQTELSQLVLTIDKLAEHYLSQSRVPGFRRWMEHERKYFEFHGLTGQWFLGDPTPSAEAQRKAIADLGQSLSLFGAQRALFNAGDDELQGAEFRKNRKPRGMFDGNKFEPLIKLLGDLSGDGKSFSSLAIADKDSLYKLYPVFLSQIHLLKVTGQFRRLRTRLIALIRALRHHRFSLETANNGKSAVEIADEIRTSITREVHLWFGIALLSLNDNDVYPAEESYSKLIREALTCDRRAPGDWTQTPRNLVYYFSEDMVMWACSLLLIFSEHDHAITPLVKEYRDEFWRLFPDESAIGKSVPQVSPGEALATELDLSFLKTDQTEMKAPQVRFRIRNNLDLLLTELGYHKTTLNDEIVRYLQLQLVYTRKDHNPITSAMQRAFDVLPEDLGDRQFKVNELRNDPAAHQPKNYEQYEIPQGPKRRKVQATLEDAIYATGSLQQISQVLPDFFRFTAVKREDVQKYVDAGPRSFPADVRLMAQTFVRMRSENRVNLGDYRDTEKAWKRVEYEMYDDDSRLRKALLNYIVDINGDPNEPEAGAKVKKGLLTKALELAETTLERKSAVESIEHNAKLRHKLELYAATLKHFRAQYLGTRDPSFVLADYWVAVETLKNMFTNVQHAYGDTAFDALPETLMELHVSQPAQSQHVVITANYFGRMFPWDALPERAHSTTMARHRSEIEQLGGRLDWGNPADRGGSWIALRLWSRENPERKEKKL